MEIISVQKYILTSPYKLREVAIMVKKMNANEAVEKLPFVAKRASEPLRKAIMTTIANAKQKNVNVSDLFIKEIQINEGPRLKRWRAASRGRMKPYKKRMSHIRVVLTTKSEAPNPKPETVVRKQKSIMSQSKERKEKKI